MDKRIIFNPFLIIWIYYFIGPFLTTTQILDYATAESFFDKSQLFYKLLYHTLAYLSILPFVLYLAIKIKDQVHKEISVKVLLGTRLFVITLIIAFCLNLLFFLYSNSILLLGADYLRAVAYMNYLEEYRIITLLLLLLVTIYLYLDKKYIIILGICVFVFDSLMSRRNLMIFFIYPLLKKVTIKHLAVIFIFFSLFSILRHRENVTVNISSLYAPFFSESYMVFLSNVNYNNCPFKVDSIFQYFDFERKFQYCARAAGLAGGFSGRFYYNIFFGIFSVLIFTLLTSSLLSILGKYINNRLQPLLKIILFVTLFIIFRDSLWNALLFFLKYFFVLLGASMLVSFFNKLFVLRSGTHGF